MQEIVHGGATVIFVSHNLKAVTEICDRALFLDYGDVRAIGPAHEVADQYIRHVAKQAETGVKLLWGTANMFSNPRFMHGAATSCNADVFAYSAAQVKKARINISTTSPSITCEALSGGSTISPRPTAIMARARSGTAALR